MILGNSGISRLHARILTEEDQSYVVDNGSVNKTYLNSREIEPEKKYPLVDGDEIRLMNEKFIFHREKE